MTIFLGQVATKMWQDYDFDYYEKNKNNMLSPKNVASKIVEMILDVKKYKNGDFCRDVLSMTIIVSMKKSSPKTATIQLPSMTHFFFTSFVMPSTTTPLKPSSCSFRTRR
jgi:short-subunit dehydrogenase